MGICRDGDREKWGRERGRKIKIINYKIEKTINEELILDIRNIQSSGRICS